MSPVLVLLLSSVTAAWAQAPAGNGGAASPAVPTMNAQLYRVPIDAERTLWADDTSVGPDLWWMGKFAFVYTNDPLVYRYDDGEEVTILGDAFQADLIGAVTYSRVRVGLDVPIWLASGGDLDSGGAGLGDLALDVKGTVLQRDDAPVGLAFGGRLALPTATVNAPVGNGGVGWSLQAIADRDFGPVRVAANLGTEGVPPANLDGVEWNDQFFWRLGAGYALDADGDKGVSADLAGRATYANLGGAGAPTEGMLGGWLRFNEDLVARAGAGTGLTGGIGSPDFRAVASIAYEPRKVWDADGDGILDRDDQCRTDPEDVDGWKDDDGCPDPTTTVQIVVQDPETNPVPGVQTSVRTHVGDEAGGGDLTVQLHPGEWSVKAVAPRFADAEQAFVVPEGETFQVLVTMAPNFGRIDLTVVGPNGENLDATVRVGEADAVAVAAGQARLESDPGSVTLLVQAEGYQPLRVPVAVKSGKIVLARAELKAARAKVTKEKIEILDKVFFDTGKATIKPESFSLLDDVYALLDANPDVKKVRVEGHTDSRGSARTNLSLSQARADSVKAYLVKKGIAAERLEAVGYGEEKPVDPANNAAAWDKNRRVEFMILERDGVE